MKTLNVQVRFFRKVLNNMDDIVMKTLINYGWDYD